MQMAEKKDSYAAGRDGIPSQTVERDINSLNNDFDDMPTPPDNFPDDWETRWQPSFDEVALAAQPEPKFKKSEEVTPPRTEVAPVVVEAAVESVSAEKIAEEQEQAEAAREALVTSIYIPIPKEQEPKRPPQQITVILRTTGDKERDRRRIKTIYGTLISFHGRDRFSFQVFENGLGYLIDFPNDTTRVCPEMLERLKKLLGEENWRVEEITFQ
jgi:hypothetical protein